MILRGGNGGDAGHPLVIPQSSLVIPLESFGKSTSLAGVHSRHPFVFKGELKYTEQTSASLHIQRGNLRDAGHPSGIHSVSRPVSLTLGT